MNLEIYLSAEGITRSIGYNELLKNMAKVGINNDYRKDRIKFMNEVAKNNLVDDIWRFNRNEFIETMPVLIEEGVKNANYVLDIACMDGLRTSYLAQLFPDKQFIGIDISAGVLELAEQRAERDGYNNLEFKKINMFEMSEELAPAFDCALAIDVVEPDAPFFPLLDNIEAILKPGGVVLISHRCNEKHIKLLDNVLKTRYNDFAEVAGLSFENSFQNKYIRGDRPLYNLIFKYVKG